MKILFRIPSLSNGGAEKVFLSLAKELAEIHEITFVVDNKEGGNYPLAEKYGLRVISLESKRTLNTIFPFSQLIKRENPDIVFSALTDTNAAAIISKILSFSKTKVIVSEHAAVVSHWKNKSIIKKFILWFYLIVIYRFSSKVVCVSDGLNKEIYRYTRLKNLITIYNPIRQFKSEEKPISEKNKDVLEILTVGRITKPKDIMCALRAALILKHRNLKYKWNFVGSFDDLEYKSEIDKFIIKNQLTNLVYFIDFTQEIDSYYANSDIFVLTSAWEGFGNVLVEAMQFGLNIISTDCNYGPAEILENGKFGRLVKVGDHIAIADEIQKLSLKSEFDAIAIKARSEDFQEKKIASLYSKLFYQVCRIE